MTKFNKRVAITCFTTLFSTCPTLMSYAQQISSYQDFKFYCSKEAYYYGAQSLDCDRYLQEKREVNRPALTQVTDSKAGNIGLSQVELPSGTKIKVELAQRLSSRTAEEGDQVVYFVNEDVVSPNGEVIIKKGARATGQVIEAKRAKMLGKKGKLEFTVEEVEAVDGTKVPLRSTVEREGKSRGATMVAVTALVSVLGVFIKGKNVTVEQGTIVDAYIDDDTLIEVRYP